MKKLSYLAAAMLAVMLGSCTKTKDLVATNSSSAPALPANFASSFTTPVVTYTDESAFVTSLSSYGFKNPTQITLNRTATTTGYNTVYGFNIPTANQVKGFKWNSGDEQTEDWRPQGICGFTWGTKTYILTTWYGVDSVDIPTSHNHYKGVRLALADITNMNAITYRLILLVQNIADSSTSLLYDKPKPAHKQIQYGSFIPVTMHAGGVAYFNQKIYVADTKLGLRVFDLNKLIDNVVGDPGKNSIGKQGDGTLIAFDYTCILPQTGYYKITGDAIPFSSVSQGTGTTASDKRLWTSQYADTSDPVPHIYGFPISSTGVVTGPPTVIEPIDNINSTTAVYGTQGAYRGGAKSFLTTTGNSSYEGSTARLVTYTDGASLGTRYRWPHGAESLYLDSGGLLWNLTEYETSKYGQDNRTVFCVHLSDY